MSFKVFQNNTFPQHVSDLMNLMHMVVFTGSDGEEHWNTYLTLKQKEYISLGLAQYYQCQHCIKHHFKAILRVDNVGKRSLSKNINSMILFLRIDTRTISKSEKEQWIEGWNRFAKKFAAVTDDQLVPYLIGLAIGIARDDDFLIDFCGQKLIKILKEKAIDPRSAIGELETVVIFMKAATSKNRVIDKVEQLLEN